MALTWADYQQVAAAMAETYPDADRLHLTDTDLKQMIVDLPDFEDGPEPPDDRYVRAVRNVWAAIDDDISLEELHQPLD